MHKRSFYAFLLYIFFSIAIKNHIPYLDYIRKYPEWDKARISPATEVVRARQELIQIGEAVKEKRAEEKLKRQHMDLLWKQTREQDLLLRESFVKYNKLVKENVEKRERAQQKIKEERVHQKKCTREVRILRIRKINPMGYKVTRQSFMKYRL